MLREPSRMGLELGGQYFQPPILIQVATCVDENTVERRQLIVGELALGLYQMVKFAGQIVVADVPENLGQAVVQIRFGRLRDK